MMHKIMVGPIRVYILGIFFAFLTNVYGQQQFCISGFIRDIESEESLIGANVLVKSDNIGVSTNKFGFFTIRLPKGEYTLEVSYIGYKTKTTSLALDRDTTLNFSLSEGLMINEVEKIADKKDIRQNEMGVVRLQMKTVKMLPSLFGEFDVIGTLQYMPGIQNGNEGKSSLFVRGGSSDQNLILLDDIPLYNINHFGGFLSNFNADAIQNITMYKSSFPSRYSGRLSSVLDIRMKDGDYHKYKMSGTLGLLSSKLMMEGPLVKSKSSFMVSFRKNTLPIFNMFFNQNIDYTFYDCNIKLNYRINPQNYLFFSYYSGNDNVIVQNKTGNSSILNKTTWGNITGSVRYNHIFGPRYFMNIIAGYSIYNYQNDKGTSYKLDTTIFSQANTFYSGIKDYIFKMNHEINVSSFYKVKFGLGTVIHDFTPGKTTFKRQQQTELLDTTYNNNLVRAMEYNCYLENDFYFFKNLGGNMGVHYSQYVINGKSYQSLEPRLLLNYIATPKLSFKAGYSTMQQYIHLLTNSGVGMPSDYWMPSTEKTIPEKASQYSMGIDGNINNHFSLTVEVYQKKMTDLIAFRQGESFSNNVESWEDKIVRKGKGLSRGIEFLLEKNKGKTQGWMSLTISKSERFFGELSSHYFPFKYDRLLGYNIVLVHSFNENLSVSSTWKFGSGYPVTLPVSRYPSVGNKDIYVYTDINSYRMRNYHRLDIGLNYNKKVKRGILTYTFSILNVYNRKNPYYYYFENEMIPIELEPAGHGYATGDLKLYQQSLFSFFPTFSVGFKIN